MIFRIGEAFVAIFSWRYRLGLALCLVCTHITIELTLHLSFASNAVLLLVFFLPWLRWSPRLAEHWAARGGDPDPTETGRPETG